MYSDWITADIIPQQRQKYNSSDGLKGKIFSVSDGQRRGDFPFLEQSVL